MTRAYPCSIFFFFFLRHIFVFAWNQQQHPQYIIPMSYRSLTFYRPAHGRKSSVAGSASEVEAIERLVLNSANSDKITPHHTAIQGMPGPELVFNYGASEKPKPCLCSACAARDLSKLSDAPARLR